MNAHLEDDDEPETFACYRHSDRQTALRCKDCDRPICVDCAVQGAVGIKCPDCARVSRAARGVVPTARLARGIVAGAAVALVLGVLLTSINLPFVGIILAWLAGIGIGEATRRASGGYRDPLLARVAVVAALVGFLALPLLALLATGVVGAGLAWSVIGAGVAAYAAYHRAS